MRNWLLLAALLAPGTAFAGRCPAVMILLDVSYSMNDTPSGQGVVPKKIDIAKQAIVALINKYGTRIPIGFTTFSQPDFGTCSQGITIYDEPAVNQVAHMISDVQGVQPDNGTNTGQAVTKVAMDPHMNDTSRPGSVIILITDGEPNCPAAGMMEPDYTVAQITMAASAGINTFVVGFGQLPSDAAMNMDRMATEGKETCSGTNCNGHLYYAADSAQSLSDAIDKISTKIVGEFDAQCDDSCYSNMCPNAGDVCVAGACKPDQCANVGPCAQGEYCYTNGSSPGVCVRPCAPCGGAATCYMGQCRTDPCATASCVTGQVCVNGQCTNDVCSTMQCDTHLVCVGGSCVDPPCQFITCPMNSTCDAVSGFCVGSSSGGTTTHRAAASGCNVGGGDARAAFFTLSALLLAGVVRRRRRR